MGFLREAAREARAQSDATGEVDALIRHALLMRALSMSTPAQTAEAVRTQKAVEPPSAPGRTGNDARRPLEALCVRSLHASMTAVRKHCRRRCR